MGLFDVGVKKKKRAKKTRVYHEKFYVKEVNRWLMSPIKMVFGPYQVEVAGPFPIDSEIVIHPILKTVEVKEKDKPWYEVAMENLELCED